MLLLMAGASPAPAQHVTAEEAMKRYAETFKPVSISDCPPVADADVITVCGKRNERDANRLPLPVARVPGERVGGEPASVGPDCIRLCHQPVRVDLMRAVPIVLEGIKKILDPDR